MLLDLMILDGSLQKKQAISDILQCNEFTKQYSLALTEQQAAELVETRTCSLRNVGRVEFGGGVIDKLIKEFHDSPYISQYNYAETLNELIEIFYYFKNETLDLMSDDSLIKYMKKCFDGVCQGSLEALRFREMEIVARNLRYGNCPDYREDDGDQTGEAYDDDQY